MLENRFCDLYFTFSCEFSLYDTPYHPAPRPSTMWELQRDLDRYLLKPGDTGRHWLMPKEKVFEWEAGWSELCQHSRALHLGCKHFLAYARPKLYFSGDQIKSTVRMWVWVVLKGILSQRASWNGGGVLDKKRMKVSLDREVEGDCKQMLKGEVLLEWSNSSRTGPEGKCLRRPQILK